MILTDERAIQAVRAALRWMKIHNVRWLKTEEKVYSREHNYAGTTDGLAYVDSCSDPACCTETYKQRLCLVDWKTSNHLSTIYCFQTAAYQQALQEENNSPIESRWVLRLGKSEEEAGKFEPWFLSNKDFVTDLDAFLACLRLTRLVDSVEERMKSQKSTIRAVKKEQRQTAKALQKEADKLQKALDKAAKKVEREAEKQKIKAEAKATREAAKAAKKAGVLECTSTSTTALTPTESVISLASSSHEPEVLAKNPDIPQPETPQPELTTSTVEAEKPAESIPKPTPQEALGAPASLNYETEVEAPTLKLPMEG